MQFLYGGGGTATASNPSPRPPRKVIQGYSRPFMPGYVSAPRPAAVIHRTVRGKHDGGDATLRNSIPAMTKALAVTCLVFNILIPGFGTFMAGLSVLCCSRIRQKNTTKSSVVWVNTWVALLQLVTTFLFLLGWIWSVMWGAAFLSISDEYYKKPSDKATRASTDANGSTAPDATRPLAVTRTSGTPPDNIMISLKAAPLIRMQPQPPPPPEDRIMQPKSRQQILMERHLVHSELSPFNVTEERLQDIVLHNVPDRGGRRSARPDECGGTVIDDIRSET